jgi:DmsE family decaheme c-type cytochrome
MANLRVGLVVVAVLVLFAGTGEAAPVSKPVAPDPGAYVGNETCIRCHREAAATFTDTVHGRILLKHPRSPLEALGCESCHGSAVAHAEAGGDTLDGLITYGRRSPVPMEQQNASCLQCHERTARLYWQGGPHDLRDVGCVSCHTVMKQVAERALLARPDEIATCGQCHLQRRAQTMRFSHMALREGKLTCTSCHEPHGSPTPALLKANSVNESCYACHAEKRGPFLWEHAPVVESCSNCHEPHGTNRPSLLKVNLPRLCQTCHIETGHPTNPQSPTSRFVFNRSCVNCHSQVHGSNHPSGFRWNR